MSTPLHRPTPRTAHSEDQCGRLAVTSPLAGRRRQQVPHSLESLFRQQGSANSKSLGTPASAGGLAEPFCIQFFFGGNFLTDSKEVGTWVDGEDPAQAQHRVIMMGMMNVTLVLGRPPRLMPSFSKRQRRTRSSSRSLYLDCSCVL